MDMTEINKARNKRSCVYSAVDYFISNNAALSNCGDSLEWEDFENLPEWYLWKEDELQRLVLVAGTVFLLPTIRLWIEAKKINNIQVLIGKTVYEFIMQYTHIGSSPEQKIEMDNLKGVLKTAGASVVLSSQESRLHPWLESKLPKAKGQLNKKVATELLNHSLYVLYQTNNISSNEQVEDSKESLSSYSEEQAGLS